MYCFTTVSGAPPHDPAKEEPDQKCPPQRYRRTGLTTTFVAGTLTSIAESVPFGLSPGDGLGA
jgi:hypothetical protein